MTDLMLQQGWCSVCDDRQSCIQEELKATDSQQILYRRCIHDLISTVERGRQNRKALLYGPPSSGKSVALAALVSYFRQAGRLVRGSWAASNSI